jgi:hypothetical protein
MSARSFRFVSPGIFTREIDNSQIPSTLNNVGPIIFGRTTKGPAMRPVIVRSVEEFVRVFGEPVPGGVGATVDVWTNSAVPATTYASYAAIGYLRSGVGPIIMMRLLGEESDTATTAGKAGWTTSGSATTSVSTNGGAYGLFIMPSASATTHVTGTLAAVWYMEKGAIVLSGTAPDGNAATGSATIFASQGPYAEFKAIVVNESNSTITNGVTSFNFNPDSDLYIRKKFNTNPILTNNAVTTTTNLKNYWLGETFTRNVDDTLGDVTSLLTGQQYAFIAALGSSSVGREDMRMGSEPAETGWFISQDVSTNYASYDPTTMTKLFKLICLDNGDYAQNNYKISLTNIKRSAYPDLDPYGKFTIQIRNVSEKDKNVEAVETFSNVDLNPSSDDYIVKRIGDKYYEWDDTDRRLREYGNYSNASNIVRVEVTSEVENGLVDPSLLPFGFLAAPKFKGFTIHSGSAYASSFGSATPSQFNHVFAKGGTAITKPYKSNVFVDAPTNFTASFNFPSFPLRATATEDGTRVRNVTKAYFGITTRKTDDGVDFYPNYSDYARALPASLYATEVESTDLRLEYGVKFSLDNVKVTRDSSNVVIEGEYSSTYRTTGVSETAVSGGYRYILDAGFDKFTAPLYGGFNGYDITESEPIINNTYIGNGTDSNNYMFNTISRAIDTVSDPDFVDCNLMTIPGLTNENLTLQLINTCEERGDALAIIDIENDYVSQYENTLDETSRRPDVDQAVASIKDRAINSSYGCCFFPAVQIVDDISGRRVVVPPSVVALGTFASSEARSELWFAPAGFNRGGLSQGSAGWDVTSTKLHLNSADRDSLYENNINPIASFPSNNIVIFGQKTLQITPSALDRINVRRLMIYLKKQISRISQNVLFQQNVRATWDDFSTRANTFLRSVRGRLGITEYRFVLDETTTTPDLIDRNILYAKVLVKPARSIEFIALDFVITRTGASFAD